MELDFLKNTFACGIVVGIIGFIFFIILCCIIIGFSKWIHSINETIKKYNELKTRVEKLEKKKRGD